MAKSATKPDDDGDRPSKLDEAIERVMSSMDKYGFRMSYADMKKAVGWPEGYHNITKLARTLEERGLCRQEKREEDTLRHWTPTTQGARMTKGKPPKGKPSKGSAKGKPAKTAASK